MVFDDDDDDDDYHKNDGDNDVDDANNDCQFVCSMGHPLVCHHYNFEGWIKKGIVESWEGGKKEMYVINSVTFAAKI